MNGHLGGFRYLTVTKKNVTANNVFRMRFIFAEVYFLGTFWDVGWLWQRVEAPLVLLDVAKSPPKEACLTAFPPAIRETPRFPAASPTKCVDTFLDFCPCVGRETVSQVRF